MRNDDMTHPHEETLLLVAQGLGDAATADAVADHARGCPACEESLRHLVAVAESARADLPAQQVSTSGSRRWARPALAVAAVAAVLVLTVFATGRLGDDGAAGPYWLPTGFETAAMRSTGARLPDGFTDALALYEQRDLAAAAAALQGLDLAEGWADLRDVYLYATLVADRHYGAADAVYERLDASTLPFLFRNAVRWYRYVQLDASDQPGAARRQLELLQETPGPVGDLARAEMAKRTG